MEILWGLSSSAFFVICCSAVMISILGTIGNSLSAMVLVRKEMRSPSTCVLLGLNAFDLLTTICMTITYSMDAQYYHTLHKNKPYTLEFRFYFTEFFMYPIKRTGK